MLFGRLGKQAQLRQIIQKSFGGGHHHKYDWRTDPQKNPFHTTDFSDVGLEGVHLQSPTVADPLPMYVYPPPEGVDISSPNINFNPSRPIPPSPIIMRAPDWDFQHDVDHEADFGSEDMDFQPECYKTQHFHKQGWLFPWVLVAMAGPLYVLFELVYMHYPDHNWFKKPRPLNLQDPESPFTKFDKKVYEVRDTVYRFDYDSGVSKPRWKIENDNIVFDRFAGVNQVQHPV